MTKELKEIILKKIEEGEKHGWDFLSDSDVLDIIEEAKAKDIPCGRKELHEAGIDW